VVSGKQKQLTTNKVARNPAPEGGMSLKFAKKKQIVQQADLPPFFITLHM
jgi:hypothetical protein